MPAPFCAPFPIRSLADVRRLEHGPPERAVGVASTYALIRDVARVWPQRPALSFLRSVDPAQPMDRWNYAELLAGVHRSANLLHRLGVAPTDAVAVLLPGCLAYHLALWGGSAAAIVQPLNPLLDEAHLAAMLRASGAVALIAYGAAAEADYWPKAQRLQAALPSLRHLLRVTPVGEPPRADDFDALIAREPADRLCSGRRIARTDIAAYFHTGGTTGAPKLARHTPWRRRSSPAWACVMTQASASRRADQRLPLFHVAGVLPGALAALAAGADDRDPDHRLMRNREVVANYWKLVERLGATVLSGVPTVLAALLQVPIGDADISSLRMCRTRRRHPAAGAGRRA